MSNRLATETSPYLLAHSENPVNWYPWCEEAFERAEAEDKPVFLSIGYSTCHWCHVMAHESFENSETADILNRYFISVKVDREQRPDIDSVYMAVCQAFTGSGGWPTSIFMPSGQKPFYAGTYFPGKSFRGMPGFRDILLSIVRMWQTDRESLLSSSDEIVKTVSSRRTSASSEADDDIISDAVRMFRRTFDSEYGGFGSAPKFPSPHNLLFLLDRYEKTGDRELLAMAEKTLTQLYRGGIFDHIGYGFCRYSTDRYFLIPHFEKMLYDNALLISAYCKAYEVTGKSFYRDIAVKTADYVMSGMTSPEGGFYSAQDADSDGTEGAYYAFSPDEIIRVLGKNDGNAFNSRYGITKEGNFEGKSVPSLLHQSDSSINCDSFLPLLREYRKQRYSLYTDDKILTSWNSLMISAFCSLYRITGNSAYLDTAVKAKIFIDTHLREGDTLYVSYRNGKKGEKGFLDDYAFYAYALISLYNAALDTGYLEEAMKTADKAVKEFSDGENGGFFLYGEESEKLFFRPKETYDGAVPSGNSVMTRVLVCLSYLLPDYDIKETLKKQLDFMYGEAKGYPSGYALFLTALSEFFDPPRLITVIYTDKKDIESLPLTVPSGSIIRALAAPASGYELLNGKTTYYVCENRTCLPPSNTLSI